MLTPGLLILLVGRRDAAEGEETGRIEEHQGVALICWLIPSAATFPRKVTLCRLNSVSDSFPTSSVMSRTRARVQTAVKSSVRGAAALKTK